MSDEAADLAKENAIDARIAEARQNLSVRLSELDRRVDFMRHRIDPRGWLENPWARVGVAAAVGFALGRSEVMAPIVKAAVGTALNTLVHQLVSRIEV
jgi:ElaB/YqjD/DUF883 family membrane-anchored ribosome-binding protein